MYAFFRSKVLNSLMILMIVCLFLMSYTGFMLLPSVCGSLALLLFASYAIWFWVRKPESIVINSWISDMNGWFTLYFLIISAMNAPGQWWYIFPVVSSVILFFISLIRDKDEVYVIHQT